MSLSETLAELRDLNEDVPTPLRLPSREEVDSVEKSLGVNFHSDYRKFLLKASDVVLGAIEPATVVDESSHTYLPKICEDAWEKMGLPRKLLPICEDNGDYYCMTEDGQVVFWSHNDNGLSGEAWSSLGEWVEEVWIAES